MPAGSVGVPISCSHRCLAGSFKPALSRTFSKALGIAAVPHGFRSSFRDWCGETAVDFAVSEKCLAHTVGSQVTKAYARSSLFNLRVKVMEDWAAYVYRNV